MCKPDPPEPSSSTEMDVLDAGFGANLRSGTQRSSHAGVPSYGSVELVSTVADLNKESQFATTDATNADVEAPPLATQATSSSRYRQLKSQLAAKSPLGVARP